MSLAKLETRVAARASPINRSVGITVDIHVLTEPRTIHEGSPGAADADPLQPRSTVGISQRVIFVLHAFWTHQHKTLETTCAGAVAGVKSIAERIDCSADALREKEILGALDANIVGKLSAVGIDGSNISRGVNALT